MSGMKCFGWAAVACLALCGSAEAATMIDDFSVPVPAASFSISPDGNPSMFNHAVSPNTSRNVLLLVNSAVTFQSLFGGIGEGILVASFNTVSTGAVSVTYSFAAPLDLSGDNALAINSAASAGFGANTPLSINIGTTSGTRTLSTTLANNATITPVIFHYAGFSGAGDLSQVTSLSLQITGNAASSFLIDSVSSVTVPEPSTWMSLLLAAPLLAASRRRRKQ
jgi:hypothetical protein